MRRKPPNPPSLFIARLSLRRRPLAYWLIAALVAATTAMTIGGLTARAEQAAARYGGLQRVVVADHPLVAGDELAAGDVRVDHVPRSFVPDDAISVVPARSTVLSPIFPGEIIVEGRLAPEGLHGVAALLRPGTLALAVPTGADGLRVAVGDVVDLLATPGYDAGAGAGGEASGAGGGATTIVASDAQVVDVGDGTITVSVRESEAPRVAAALARASITLALARG